MMYVNDLSGIWKSFPKVGATLLKHLDIHCQESPKTSAYSIIVYSSFGKSNEQDLSSRDLGELGFFPRRKSRIGSNFLSLTYGHL